MNGYLGKMLSNDLDHFFMNYKIIEDCSPYYIVFTHDGLDEFVSYAKECCPGLSRIDNSALDQIAGKFVHYNLANHNKTLSDSLLKRTPVSEDLELQDTRVSYFVSGPGLYYRAHKDGLADRYSINYPIVVNDESCVTSWYSDNDLDRYSIDHLPSQISRECKEFDKSKHTPLKSMVARPGTCILFNTDIFHDWDNSASNSHRVVLTFRQNNPDNVYFEDARKALFGY